MNYVINDVLHFPSWGRGVYYVWRRNFIYFRYTIFVAASWMFLEPLLYILALGYGLGRFVSEINGMPYAAFIAPAMMATTGMFVSFFDAAYGTYTRLARDNTYKSVLLTPISSDELALGEIVWCATKGFMSVIAVSLVIMFMGLAQAENFLGVYLVLGLMCWLFASLGVLMATMAKSYDWFLFAQTGFIMPMSLFCGTYFPLEELPELFKWIIYAFPLTHAMESVRMFFSGRLPFQFFY